MKFLNKPVVYLQNTDFNEGELTLPPSITKNRDVLIMIQSNFCHFCSMSKPDFQRFAETHENILCATIQGDGEVKGEKELMNKIETIHPNFKGFPSYVAYRHGKRVGVHEGGRGLKELEKFMKMI
jgi:thiol-disulfide isomerase/thioredoxin